MGGLLTLCWRSRTSFVRVLFDSPTSATLPGFALDDLPRRVPSAHDDMPDTSANLHG